MASSFHIFVHETATVVLIYVAVAESACIPKIFVVLGIHVVCMLLLKFICFYDEFNLDELTIIVFSIQVPI